MCRLRVQQVAFADVCKCTLLADALALQGMQSLLTCRKLRSSISLGGNVVHYSHL